MYLRGVLSRGTRYVLGKHILGKHILGKYEMIDNERLRKCVLRAYTCLRKTQLYLRQTYYVMTSCQLVILSVQHILGKHYNI